MKILLQVNESVRCQLWGQDFFLYLTRGGGPLREAGERAARLERPSAVLVRAADAGRGPRADPAQSPAAERSAGPPCRCPSGPPPRGAGGAPVGSSRPRPERPRQPEPRPWRGGRRHGRGRSCRSCAGPAAGGAVRVPPRHAETSVRRHRAAADGARGRVGPGEAVGPREEENGPLGARAGAAPLGRSRRDPPLADGGPRERGEPVAGGRQAADRRVQEPAHGRAGRGQQRSWAQPGGACAARSCELSGAA